MQKAAAEEPEEPGILEKAWDRTMENFGAGTPLAVPLEAVDQVMPGFREDFGRGLVEDTAVGLKDLAVMGVQLSPAYRLIDSEGQDRKAQQLSDTANFAYHHPGDFLKQAGGIDHAEQGHPGRMIGGWVPALIPVGGGAVRGATTLGRTAKIPPRPTPPAPEPVPNLTVRHQGQVVFQTDAHGNQVVPPRPELTAEKGDLREAMRADELFLEKGRDADKFRTGEVQGKRQGLPEAARRALQHLEDLGGG